MPLYRVRVRGPYATALAKLLQDLGFELVDLSRKLAARLTVDQRSDVPPHVTVKESDEDPNTLVVVGYRDAVEALLEGLLSALPFVGYMYEPLGPYTTISVRLRGYDKGGNCVGETVDGREVIVQNLRDCIEGAYVVAHVVKPAWRPSARRATALLGAAVVKDTVVVLDDGSGAVHFSEHLRDFERRAALSSISKQAQREGFSVRWRSAARSAPLSKAMKDLEEALEEIRGLRGHGITALRVLHEGEAIAFLTLSRPAKEYLDLIRSQVLPTTPLHHQLKVCLRHCGDLVDLLDEASASADWGQLERSLWRGLLNSLRERSVVLKHQRPGLEPLELGPMSVIDVVENEGLGPVIVGRRIIRKEGVYDGLGIEKEPGDIAWSVVPVNQWFIVHRYTDARGNEKGVYVNINTPPEVCPAGGYIRYVDLIVDVALVNGSIRVLDYDEFERARAQGLIGEDAAAVAGEVVKNCASYAELARKLIEVATQRFLSQVTPSS